MTGIGISEGSPLGAGGVSGSGSGDVTAAAGAVSGSAVTVLGSAAVGCGVGAVSDFTGFSGVVICGVASTGVTGSGSSARGNSDEAGVVADGTGLVWVTPGVAAGATTPSD